MKRDENIIFNRESIKYDPENFFIWEWSKIRHMTKIVTFSKKKVSIIRVFDIGINTLMVA